MRQQLALALGVNSTYQTIEQVDLPSRPCYFDLTPWSVQAKAAKMLRSAPAPTASASPPSQRRPPFSTTLPTLLGESTAKLFSYSPPNHFLNTPSQE